MGVDTVELGEALGNKTCAVFEDFSARITFDAEYSMAAYNVNVLQLVNFIPNFILCH